MGLLAVLHHLLNFAAPAAFVALLLALSAAARVRGGARVALRVLWRSFWINAAIGTAASAAALVALGDDGTMAGYAALVLACASSQWLLCRGWAKQQGAPAIGAAVPPRAERRRR